MGQQLSDVNVKDVRRVPSMEEFVGDMGQRNIRAFIKDAPIMSSKEEFVRGMGQRQNGMNAVMMDVQTMQRKEDYVLDMDGLCIRHGAKNKWQYECSYGGCTNHVVKGGVCISHGATRK